MKEHFTIPPVIAALALGTAMAGEPESAFKTEPIAVNGMFNNRSSVEIDADGVVHLVWASQFHTDSSTAEVFYANNAGGSWNTVQVTDNAVREEFPCLTLDQQGHVHIAVHTGVPGGNHIRYVNNVGAPPGQFNEIVDITPPSGTFYVIVELRVDSKGTAHMTFRSQTPTTGEDIFYTTWSEKDGVGPLENISNTPGGWTVAPQIAIGPDDAVHLIYADGLISGPLVYLKKERGGSFATVATTAAGSVIDPMILVSDDDAVSIIYRQSNVLWLIEDKGTGSFSEPQPLFTGVTALPAFYERFAIDAKGRRHIAFASNSQDLRGIWYIGETIDGFSDPVQVAGEDLGNSGTSIAVGPDGEIVVTYSLSGSADGIVFADLFAGILSADAGRPCPGDLTGDGEVDVFDLLDLLAAWGDCPAKGRCPADLNRDNAVDVFDLLDLLAAWGPC